MSTTWQTPISSFETNRRRVGALKSLGVVSVGDALTYYPFRVTEPVPARALREAKIGEKMGVRRARAWRARLSDGPSRIPADRRR